MNWFDCFSKPLYDIEKLKSELLAVEEKRLREQYPDEDAWRAPRNMGETMGCVGCAQIMLNNFEEMLNRMTDTEIIKMHKRKK